ncbi:MAG: hypothetical protein IMX03_01230 [Brockia lithotrophica]|nr:hypothetical protein [Brockia lithotrophica]
MGTTTSAHPEDLAGEFVDEVSLSFFRDFRDNRDNRAARQARRSYVQRAPSYVQHAAGEIKIRDLYPMLQAVPDFSNLPSSHWLALQVDFEFLTPWYSKDDRMFHVLDNPVRKDRVFGVPFMAASSWKGMLRWACRMRAGLREHLERHNGRLDGRRDLDWILHLFGHEKGEEDHEKLRQGALVFFPTWFDRIGFEVINPHSRERRAGTQPIYYEVVPPGAKGTLSLLYAPWPGMKFNSDPKEVVPKLLEAIEDLLTTYGISAKRTVGWGTAGIERWRAFHKTGGRVKTVEQRDREALWQEVQTWFQQEVRHDEQLFSGGDSA